MPTKKWNHVRARKVPADQEAAATESRRALGDALDLAALRVSKGMTQVELAGRLRIRQSSVSELERRGDVYLSSLRDYVEALGGQIEIVAVFDGDRFPITLRESRGSQASPAGGPAVAAPRASTRSR